MGREVAPGRYRGEWNNSQGSEERSSRKTKRVQNQTARRTCSRAATRRSKLANLQTTSHCDIFGVREEVADGRALSTQTLNSIGRQIADPETPGPRARSNVHEGHHSRSTASPGRAEGHGSLGEVRAQPDSSARRNVGASKSRQLHADRSVRESRAPGPGPHQRALSRARRDETGDRRGTGAVPDVLLDSGRERNPLWRGLWAPHAKPDARNSERSKSIRRFGTGKSRR
jgi:hypothetical protein